MGWGGVGGEGGGVVGWVSVCGCVCGEGEGRRRGKLFVRSVTPEYAMLCLPAATE